ncbi:MAG TPA: right-handed parallel beta-helix repeat-containing protein, partial [Verrucomicrobiae bacterium]
IAAIPTDPYESFKILGNRRGLKVCDSENFSSAPLVLGIIGLVIAGNTEQGAIFERAITASLIYAYIMYNGGLNPCGGGIWLRGTTGMLLRYLEVDHCYPYGIELDNGRNILNTGTSLRDTWMKFNGLPGFGAAFYADRAGWNTIDNCWFNDNFNHGVYLKKLTTSGQNRLYGSTILRNGGAGIFVESSHFVDVGGESASQENTIGLNGGGGVISHMSGDIKWLYNTYSVYNTPRTVAPTQSHAMSATRTIDGSDYIITITGHGPANQPVEIAVYKGIVTPIGASFENFNTMTANTDANGNFTVTYRKPISAPDSDVAVMAAFGFLDCSEMVPILSGSHDGVGNFTANLSGPITIQAGQSIEYTATFKFDHISAPTTYTTFNGTIPVPAGVTVESVTMQTDANSHGYYNLVGDSIVVGGNIRAGETITVKFTVRASQVGFFDINLTDSLMNDDDNAGDNNAQMHVQVVTEITPPMLTYSYTQNTLKLFFDVDAKLESKTDLSDPNWQRSDQPSPFTVDRNKPMEFFRVVRPIF